MITERQKLIEGLSHVEHIHGPGMKEVLDAARKHLATLPPEPRKVKVTRWLITDKSDNFQVLSTARVDPSDYPASRVIEMTGEYEED
jgi:hypothetical protein